jgi:hypothetical protein
MLTSVAIIIRLQPYDDHELRVFLLPTSCPAPCFMGIRPGVTNAEEAIAVLKASGWAKDIKHEGFFITWAWSGTQPTSINTDVKPYINLTNGSNGVQVVFEIILPTQFTIGSVMFIMKNPAAFLVLPDKGQRVSNYVNIVALRYDDLGVNSYTICPSNLHDLMSRKATIILYNRYDSRFFPEEYPWDYQKFIRALVNKSGC